MKYSSGKEIDALVRRLVQEGWHFRRGSRHGQLYSPRGWPRVIVPTTPGDRRAFMNFRQDVRRIMDTHD